MLTIIGRAATVFLLVLFLLPAGGAFAQAASDKADAVEALMDLLIVKKVITRQEADALRKEMTGTLGNESGMISGSASEEKRIEKEIKRVEEKLDRTTDQFFQTGRVAAQKHDELEKKVFEDLSEKMKAVSWAKRIQIGGDLRLRYDGHLYDEGNADLLDPADPDTLLNTKTDRHRFRYRLRLDAKANLIDDKETKAGKLEAGVRLSTGSDKDPISTNDTLGDYQNKDGILVDRAYLKWTYALQAPVRGLLPGFSLQGGRIPNPWVSSDLVWDSDLNFEGVALKLASDTRESGIWSSFLTLGAFSIQEENFSNRDKWLYAAQTGIDVTPSKSLKGSLAVAYYDYRNMEGIVNDPLLPGETNFTAPLFQQKGNTLIDIDPSTGIKTALAADYNLLNVTARATLSTFSPVCISFLGDVVVNLGFDKDLVKKRTGVDTIPDDIFGYQTGMEIGYPTIREFGEWNVSLYYRYLESDAVLDAFTDSDFHDGGTNSEGWIFGFEYGLFKNVWTAFKWRTSDEIAGPPVAIDVIQVDLNARF